MSLGNIANLKAIHILRDGTVLDSVEGHVVKFEDAEPLYHLIQNINNGKAKK